MLKVSATGHNYSVANARRIDAGLNRLSVSRDVPHPAAVSHSESAHKATARCIQTWRARAEVQVPTGCVAEGGVRGEVVGNGVLPGYAIHPVSTDIAIYVAA
jgi:hypothetical protein